VGLGALVSRFDRWASRFNRWFGGAAIAANVADSGALSGGSSAVDPTAVVAALGEIEPERRRDDDG
jgi:hypothetical protein